MKNFLASAILLLIANAVSAQDSADIILINGKIFTGESVQHYVEALAIKGNRILASGKSIDITKLAGPKTKKIDLAGRTVIPGFNDAHDHLAYGMPSRTGFTSEFSVPGLSKKSVVDSLARILKKVKKSEWVTGPIGMNILGDPTILQTLDSLAPDNPVALNIMWGHGAMINTRAMKALHIAVDEADPLGGWYGRKPGTRLLSGAMYEYAQWPLWHMQNVQDPAAMTKGLHAYGDILIAMGITTIQDLSCSFSAPQTVEYLTKSNFPQRIRIIPFPGTTKNGRDILPWKKVNHHPAPLITVSGMKYLIDGTPYEETALLKHPYPGRPGWYGRFDMPVDTIKKILHEAYTGNTQLMMHIVGDSAMTVVLRLMKETGNAEVWKTKRVRFEHNASGLATAQDRKDIHDLGIIMAHTPKYGHTSRLKSWIDAGVTVSISPDGIISPFWDVMVMTSQQAEPDENITREQAVIAYTRTNAFAEFAETEKGTLAKGMLADLAVLSSDLFTIPTEQLPSVKSVLTMVDGKIAYDTMTKGN